MAETSCSQFGNEDPFFEADNIPFVAIGFDNAWKFFQAHKPFVEKRMQRRGLRVLYSVAWPGQGIYTKTPINSIRRPEGREVPHLQPDDGANGGAGRRDADHGASGGSAASVRDQHRAPP